MRGTPFGRYQLQELLGRGGMGEVWRALDTAAHNRPVAIKLLPPQLAADDMFVQRFRREAEAAAQLNNPHIIPIHNYGEIDGRLYVDMRLVEGRDLAEVLSAGPLPPERAVHIVGQVATALRAAHKVGLVHRDVKPSNILLDEDDFAYLIDFGIARGADHTGLTNTGAMIGSYHYMAPERFSAREADARADIYALACVLYQCLTGSRPFPGDTLESQVAGHLTVPPPQPSAARSEVPAAFDEVIAKGMAKEPEQRYQSVAEFAIAARDAPTVPVRIANVQTVEDRDTTQTAETVVDHPDTLPPQLIHPPTLLASALPKPHEGRAGPPSRLSPLQWTSSRTRVALAAGAGVLVVVVAAVVGIVLLQPAAPHVSSSPHVMTYSSQVPVPFTGLNSPRGVAVDGAGNLYVSDGGSNRLLKLAPGASSQTVLPVTVNGSLGDVAVDGAGNLYVSDQDYNRVLKLAPGASSQTVLPVTGLSSIGGVAVNGSGNLYVTDYFTNRVLELPAGATSPLVLPFTGLSSPGGVAVDGSGNLYVAEYSTNRVLELPAGATSPLVLPFTGLNSPAGVAVDGSGNLYVTDRGNGRVLKLAAGDTSQTVLPFTDIKPNAVAVDGAGNLYVCDFSNNRVLKLPAA